MPKLTLLSTHDGTRVTFGAYAWSVDDKGTVFGTVGLRPVRWTSPSAAPQIVRPAGTPIDATGGFWTANPAGFAVGEVAKRGLIATATQAVLVPASYGVESLCAISPVSGSSFWTLGIGPGGMQALRIGTTSLDVQEAILVDAGLWPNGSLAIDAAGRIAGYSGEHKRVVFLDRNGTTFTQHPLPVELDHAANFVVYDGRLHLVGRRKSSENLGRAGILRLPVDLATVSIAAQWEDFPLVEVRGPAAAGPAYLPNSADRWPFSQAMLASTPMFAYEAAVVTRAYSSAITAVCGVPEVSSSAWLTAARWAGGTTTNLNDELRPDLAFGTGASMGQVERVRLISAFGINSRGDIVGMADVEFKDTGDRNINPHRESPFLLQLDADGSSGGRASDDDDEGGGGEFRLASTPDADGYFVARPSKLAAMDPRRIRRLPGPERPTLPPRKPTAPSRAPAEPTPRKPGSRRRSRS
ncbi:MAG: hypothetical protein K1X88_14915 [Nannocystaceae bacterium]|nr:hypothetical protein [Nannocystaceae bacterium]